MANVEKSSSSSSDSIGLVEISSLRVTSPLGPANRTRSHLHGDSRVQSSSTDIGGRTSDTTGSSKGSAVVDFPSILSVDDLEILRKAYLIPTTYKMFVLEPLTRIFYDLSPKRLLVYEEILKARVRFPLSLFYVYVLKNFNIVLSQLNLNS